MNLWRITPLDPLVVRDGRPNQGRSESATLPFPLPGTVAGVVRTRMGSDDRGVFDRAQSLDELRLVEIRGPLLERASDDASAEDTLLVAAPRDALILGADGSRELRALHPLEAHSLAGALMDDGAPGAPVGLDYDEHVDGKVPADLPVWWRWSSLSRWLSSTRTEARVLSVDELLAGGVRALPREQRIHVALGPTRVARESMLFATEGLRFVDGERGAMSSPLSMLVAVTSDPGRTLRPGVGPFAGERRTVRWSSRSTSLPTVPERVRAHVVAPGSIARVRVLLLTPAHWRAGSMPDLAASNHPLGSREGLRVTPDASLVGRPETISGWDFHARAPKGTRRLVPAGSVLWLTIEGDPAQRSEWLERVWMQNVSDDEASRRDGFGLAVVGVA